MFSLRVLPWLSSRTLMSEANVSIVPVAASVSGDGSASRQLIGSHRRTQRGRGVECERVEVRCAGAGAERERVRARSSRGHAHVHFRADRSSVWARFMGPVRDTPPRGRRLITVRFSRLESRSFPLALRSGG